MYIVETIAIEKGLPLEIISYYSKEVFGIGDLIYITIKNRTDIKAIIINVSDLRNSKANIKNNDYETKKLAKNIIKPNFIDSELIQTIIDVAIEYILPIPTLLSMIFDINYLRKIINGDNIEFDARLYIQQKLALMQPWSDNNYNPHIERDMWQIMNKIINGNTPAPIEYSPQRGGLELITDEYEYIHPLISIVTDRLVKNVLNNIYDGGKGKLFIYANRKGEAPLSRCADCGQDVLCQQCSMPMVLHRSDTTRYYLCHHCNHSIQLNNNNEELAEAYACEHCGSWRVMPLGVSTGSIKSTLLELYRDIKPELIYIIDGDETKSTSEIKRVLKSWDQSGGILISNSKGLNQLQTPCDYSIIISIDGLFSLPIYNADEKALHIINRLQGMSRKLLLLHTHLSQLTLFQALAEPDAQAREQKLIQMSRQNDEKRRLAQLYPYYHNIHTQYEEKLAQDLNQNGIIYNTFQRYNKIYTNIKVEMDKYQQKDIYVYKIYQILSQYKKYNAIYFDMYL